MDPSLIQKLKEQFSGKSVLVVGLGLQGGGVGLVKFFNQLGAKVTATDLKSQEQLSASISELQSYPVKYSLCGHKLEDFLSAQYIFKGPSVPWDLPELLEAEKKNIPIEMETSFFASLAKVMIIGITGTRGKTTAAQIIYNSLQPIRSNIFLGGNIASSSTIDLLNKVKEDDIVVLELSSWQLSGFHRKQISPHIGVFTNFYPDHLNYYKNEEKYFYDKTAIYAYQKPEDFFIANLKLKDRLVNANIKSTIRYFSAQDFPGKLVYMRGEHNYENAAVALLVNDILGSKREQAIKIISEFKGVPYRQEIVKEQGDIFFVNDSASTTPISVIKALETFNDKKIVLILGGDSKNLPFDNLLTKLNSVDYIVLLKGSFTGEIMSALKEKFMEKISEPYDNLQLAIKTALEKAKSFNQKTYLLFSPGATSFSMFNNEFDRAREFNQVVNSL